MKNRAFHFEIKDLLTQFIAAFDDTVISRYNKDRNPANNIEVRYVFAPKQRVMYDIINKAQNLTLPVVAVNLTSITRDNDRVFNKLAPSYIPAQKMENPKSASKFLMPVPVNLEVSMSILARYMQDVDQIVSNFVPYNNPYIILTWEVPSDFGADYGQEIRSEVLWNGNLAYSTPTDTTYNDKFRVTVDTSFTIKGWLFPEQKSTQGSIYKVDNNFIAVDLANKIYSPLDPTEPVQNNTYQELGYGSLSGIGLNVPTNYTETVTVSGVPEFTNIFFATTGTFIELNNFPSGTVTNILTCTNPGAANSNFILYGKRFDRSNKFYLSSYVDLAGAFAGTGGFFTNFTPITSAKMNTISGYELNDSFYKVVNDNVVNFFFATSALSASKGGEFTIVTGNEAGWATSYQASSSILKLT
tara:strand:+ start:637 stop:1878 length:1242 start_codon:yes stop_codon:yes gene_type:complete